jgi:hypothetical protein
MRLRASILVVVPFMLALAAAASSPFAGVWEGKTNDLPAVKITIPDTGPSAGGTIVFYFQTRGDDGKWHVSSTGNPEGPLIAPQVHGKTLSFEVQHHKTHGSAELGPNVKFRLELISRSEARLRKINNQPDVPGQGLKLTRRE